MTNVGKVAEKVDFGEAFGPVAEMIDFGEVVGSAVDVSEVTPTQGKEEMFLLLHWEKLIEVKYSINHVLSSFPCMYQLAEGGTAVGTGLNTVLGVYHHMQKNIGFYMKALRDGWESQFQWVWTINRL
ncbi:hypothetical protein KIW84_041237 [Lathyrus oleraceus]|uniref:Uncharacterized protein n=1 Tax=Pisum sativum TaxID=3888 RepID=A0A9D4X823_PEA|nr:hypothetical protein KIW84_041237 [Pisum sativum]